MGSLSANLRKKLEKAQAEEERRPEQVSRLDLASRVHAFLNSEDEGESYEKVENLEDIEAFGDAEEEPTTLHEAFEALVEEREVYMAVQQAHYEGYMAVLDESEFSNPYEEGSLQHEAWFEGVTDAVKELDIVRVVVAARSLMEASTEEEVQSSLDALETAVKSIDAASMESIVEMWDRAKKSGNVL